MEDFYKQFKNAYESSEEPDYNPSDWTNLERRLDEKEKKGFVLPFPLWYLAVPFVALLGWNLWLHGALSTQEKSEILLDQNNSSSLQARVDTVYKKEIVYHTDTVYLEPKLSNLPFGESDRSQEKIVYRDRVVFQDRIIYQDRPVYYLKKNDLGWVKLKKDELKDVLFSDGVLADAQESNSVLSDEMGGRDRLWSFQSLPPLSLSLNSDVKRKKREEAVFSPQLDVAAISKRRQNQKYFRPVGMDAYLGTGLLNARKAKLINLVSTSQHLGLKVRFAPGYSVWLEAAFQAMNFKTSTMGDDIGIPVVVPPSDEFDFENAEINRYSMQYSAGIDYCFLKKKRLRPFVGLGMAAVSYRSSDIFYDFLNDQTGQEWIFEEEQGVVPTTFGYGIIKTGLEYSISRRIDLQLTGTYRQSSIDAFGNNKLVWWEYLLKSKTFLDLRNICLVRFRISK